MLQILEKKEINLIRITNMMSIMGFSWRGIWQLDAMRHIMDNPTSILQGTRQLTGKTWIDAMIATCYIWSGHPVIIGMPTFGQATKIIFNAINKSTRYLEAILPKGDLVRMQPDNQSHIVWSNGAELLAMSAGKATEKEGYTGALLLLDEGHRLDPETLDIIEPFITLALMDGYGRCIITGVGGPSESLIEKKKKKKKTDKSPYIPFKVTPEMILAEDGPDKKYQNVLDHFKASMTPAGYDQMVNCNVVTAGLRYTFDLIPYDVDFPTERNRMTRETFGIDDAGHGKDHTVVTHIRVQDGKYSLDDHLDIERLGVMERAETIYGFINDYHYFEEDIGLEQQAGMGLYDVMTYAAHGYFTSMQLITMSESLKRHMVLAIKKLMLRGLFEVKDQKVRDKLEENIETSDSSGNVKYSHCDILSSTIVNMSTQQKVMALMPWGYEDAET